VECISVGIDVTERVLLKNKISQLEDLLASKSKKAKLILGWQDENQVFLKVDDIFYIEAKLKITLARVKDGFVKINKSIGTMEKELGELGFFRMHRSYLVNLNKVQRLENTQNRTQIIFFRNISDTLESSRKYTKVLRDLTNSKVLI
jgi:DNA-binding LytR/AlgR family response regulator